jgi:ribose transport system permease protein
MIARVSALLVATLFGGEAGLIVPLVLLGLSVGAGLGLLNGVLITRVYASPFIVTFGVFSVLRAIGLTIASGPVGQIPPAFLDVYDARIGDIPLSVIGMALVWAVAWCLAARTPLGRAMYAVGGSARVARLSAINVPRTQVAAYVLSGVCGAATGLFILARNGVGDPSLADGLEFQSIVAVALGGVSLYGGKGSLLGTLGGVLLLGVVSNVFNLLQVSVFFQQLLLGLVVLVAVASLKQTSARVA